MAPDPAGLRALLGDDWDGHWHDAPIRLVDLARLVPTQWPHYHPCKRTAARLGRPAEGGDLPRVIWWHGWCYAWDGHHRFAAALRSGQRTALARVREA